MSVQNGCGREVSVCAEARHGEWYLSFVQRSEIIHIVILSFYYYIFVICYLCNESNTLLLACVIDLSVLINLIKERKNT